MVSMTRNYLESIFIKIENLIDNPGNFIRGDKEIGFLVEEDLSQITLCIAEKNRDAVRRLEAVYEQFSKQNGNPKEFSKDNTKKIFSLWREGEVKYQQSAAKETASAVAAVKSASTALTAASSACPAAAVAESNGKEMSVSSVDFTILRVDILDYLTEENKSNLRKIIDLKLVRYQQTGFLKANHVERLKTMLDNKDKFSWFDARDILDDREENMITTSAMVKMFDKWMLPKTEEVKGRFIKIFSEMRNYCSGGCVSFAEQTILAALNRYKEWGFLQESHLNKLKECLNQKSKQRFIDLSKIFNSHVGSKITCQNSIALFNEWMSQ